MSNLSDIGFPTPDQESINEMIIHVLEVARPTQNARGFYLVYSDPSGAEIYLQGNFDQELVGFNPHFTGRSAVVTTLTEAIERDSSDFDGGFRARAGGIEFVFDVPDFRVVSGDGFPREASVQFTAFASNDFQIGGDSDARFEHLSAPDADTPPRPVVSICGTVIEAELRRNELSGQEFYWLSVETPIGVIDVVCDPKWIPESPKSGDPISGTFWLSGKCS